jgi:predicted MPP superfamily phosphohydrolase
MAIVVCLKSTMASPPVQRDVLAGYITVLYSNLQIVAKQKSTMAARERRLQVDPPSEIAEWRKYRGCLRFISDVHANSRNHPREHARK